ncbi:hypothetical protein AB0B31_25640 [Catellatospora citrea]|uniref:hypothetical protein n=1 Tax=Catellatospora citrea TaxID=53366 RepID=UPI0033D3B8C1
MTVDQRTARVRGLTAALLAVAVCAQMLAVLSPDRPVPWAILLQLGSLVAGTVLMGLALLRPSGSVSAFTVCDGAFVTSSRMWRYMTWGWIFLAGSLVTGSLLDGPAEGADWVGAVLRTPLVLVVLFYLFLTLKDLPRLELRPEGVRLVSLRSTTVPWTALRPGTPLRPHRNDRNLALTADRPELLPRVFRGSSMIDLGWDVHLWLVADAIRWYVDHPEHRAAIGTMAELDRLRGSVSPQGSEASSGR